MSDSDKVVLTEDQLKTALVSFAHGKSTSQVIDDLLFDYEDLEDTPDNREMLRSQLRSVNPSDNKFAKSKYGELYVMVSSAAIETLKQESKEAMRGVVNSIIGSIEEFDTIGEGLIKMLENASDNHITSNTEYLNTIRTFASLQKTKIDGVNAVSNLVEQLVRLSMLTSAGETNETD